MTRFGLLLFALIAGAGLGVLAGRRGRRLAEEGELPPPRVRPPAVEAALAAWETDGRVVPVDLPAPDAESAADLAFVRAAADGSEDALRAMAREHEGRDAAARALWRLVARAPDAETRRARREAFAARWPDAWVLAARRAP